MNVRRRKIVIVASPAVLLVLLGGAAYWHSADVSLPKEFATAERLPHIRPDYIDTVIPPNIAPLSFVVEEPGVAYRARIYAKAGEDILVGSRTPNIVIPMQAWRDLLSKNRGGRISVDVYVRDKEHGWSRFQSFANTVAEEEIDSHLAYRRLGPVCSMFHKLGIYQRNLESYDESPILTNESFAGCINCHCFVKNRPDQFSFHLRQGPDKNIASGTVVVRDGHATRFHGKSDKITSPPSYPSWHPEGSFLAFSVNSPRQLFREVGSDCREVFDMISDLAVANIHSGTISTTDSVCGLDRLETFPCWSPDGKTLFFCSAKPLWKNGEVPRLELFTKLKYDLMSVQYDIEKDVWGKPETVLAAADAGMSITEPRTSPDGRYLIFCMSDYGGFPIFRPSTDLYVMEIASRKYRRLECNSDKADSWHCWSSNSRWIVFSSKRDNELLARPYFSHIDQDGRASKPFVLPQKDPAFYDTWLYTFNVPELITGPVVVPQEELMRAVRSNVSANDQPAASKQEDSVYTLSAPE